MPEITIDVPVLGNQWAVGLVFQVHLVMVAAIMGGAIVAPAAEIIGVRRRDERYERLAHEISAYTVRFFAFAATWAVVGLVLLVGLYPRLVGVLVSIFFWPLVVVAGTWVLMTFGAYYYYYTWDRLRHRRALHVAIGLTFAVSAFLFIDLITMLSSFQLTPTEPVTLLAAMLNPSWPLEVAHRHVGNLSYVGLIIAGIAGGRALANGERDRAYNDWLGHVGLLLGVGFLLLQPAIGWFYADRIQAASPAAYHRIMIGEYARLFTVQVLFLAAVFLLGNIYLANTAVSRGNPGPRARAWMRWATWGIAALGVLIIIPPELPLGAMTPWKYISLTGFVLLSGATLVLYARAARTFTWGRVRAGSQMALVGVAVVAVALLVVMGVLRSVARGPDVIYERMSAEQAQTYEAQ